MTEIRRGLPPLTPRIAKLPVDPRGYPVPWFVAKVNGAYDFRVVEPSRKAVALRDHRCWICGEKLGRFLAFVIGPMCVVNRNTSEPPSHLDCAEYAVKACPFLMRPKAQYRTANLPEGSRVPFGSLPGNPGAQAIYSCNSFQAYRVSAVLPDVLMRLGPPTNVSWWAEGRPATRTEVLDAIAGRLHFLEEAAKTEGDAALRHLEREIAVAMKYLPV